MAPIAVALVAAGMALFWGVAGALYRALAPRGVRRVILFAGAFALLEWLRGHVLTGFPWDLPGETWRAGSPLSQAAALVGAYGLSWITGGDRCLTWRVAGGTQGPPAVAPAAASLASLFA